MIKYSFVNIWFGPLPSYFEYFAYTCKYNKDWHWYLFTDQTQIVFNVNESLTLIPYSWQQLYKDCPFLQKINHITDLGNWPKNGWPCRLFIIHLYPEIWKNSLFVGSFDCDILYGDLNSRMPHNVHKFGMITGHAGNLHPIRNKRRICAPFTLFRTDTLDCILEYIETRDNQLDANYEFSDFFAAKYPVFAGNNIQPIGECIGFQDKIYVIWKNGKLLVDGVESGFYHFIHEKTTFKKINSNSFENITVNDQWIGRDFKIFS